MGERPRLGSASYADNAKGLPAAIVSLDCRLGPELHFLEDAGGSISWAVARCAERGFGGPFPVRSDSFVRIVCCAGGRVFFFPIRSIVFSICARPSGVTRLGSRD